MRFGYLVPEFPGQTHAFFWRELAALRSLGMDPDVISTRRPDVRIMSHDWGPKAQKETTYLAPLTVTAAVGAARVLSKAAQSKRLSSIWRELVAEVLRVGKSEGPLPGAKLAVRSAALLIIGAELSHVASVRGWTHVHVHSCADSAQVALFAHQLAGLTYSLTLHGSLGDYGPNQAQKWRHAEFSTVITRQLQREAAAALGASAARSQIVPMGVDVGKFSRKSPYSPWDGAGTARIFSCGRLNASKGHDDLVRAVGVLAAQGANVELVIAGEDEEGGEGYRRYLENLIQRLNLKDRVTLLGAVGEQQVYDHLEGSHVFALASHAEPLGVAIMEAMSMELPVVVTDAGGVPELVENRRTGILVQAKAPVDLAHEILAVLLQPDQAMDLGREARKKVIAAFTSERGADALSKMILGNASNRPGPGREVRP